MKKYGIILDFKDTMITVDEVKLPMQNINYLQGSSTLCVLKLNHSLTSHGTEQHQRHNQACYTDPRGQISESRSPINYQRQLQVNHSLAMELHSTKDTTKHVTQILDSKYQNADLQLIVRDNCNHLSANQQNKLMQLLKKYELLFDGTLGDWRTKPVSFQLKEGVSSYHGQAFPVPKIHKDTIMKEVERLCKLGVLEQQPTS